MRAWRILGLTMGDWNTPTAIANQAMDAAALDFTLGDIEEGTRPAQVALRAYGECLRQLLRGAHWDFARREVPLTLLADATGQTPNVGSIVPGGQFIYEYALPQNCALVRYIPWQPFLTPGAPAVNFTPSDGSAPLMTGIGTNPGVGRRVVPARFMLSNDVNYVPADPGVDQQGISPSGRVVILTNVPQASAVYTYEALYPSVWDHQFRAAMVAYLASEIALPLARDKKFGVQMRDRNIAVAQAKIAEARRTDGNEGWSSSDIAVDWMRVRQSGGTYGPWGGYGGDGPGYCFGGLSQVGLANGSAF